MTNASEAIKKLEITRNVETPFVIDASLDSQTNWDIEVQPEKTVVIVLKTDFKNTEAKTDVNLNIRLNKKSEVKFATFVSNGDKGIRNENISIQLQEESDFQGAFLTTYCQTSSIKATADFKHNNAQCELGGLTVIGGESVAITDTVMNHHLPENTSRQLFKNIVNDKAEATYSGLVFVEKNAMKTDSEQSNTNILLSDHAKSIAKPQLQINNDDVIAAHGSTTGQLDETALFYLQSRGVSLADARRTLLYGFAEDLLDRVDNEEVSDWLEKEIETALEKVLNNG